MECAEFMSGSQNNKCIGNACEYGYKYVYENGIETDQSYPYTSGNGNVGSCQFDATKSVTRVNYYGYFPPRDELAMVNGIFYVGPITTALYAGKTGFQFYKYGVYYEADCTEDGKFCELEKESFHQFIHFF